MSDVGALWSGLWTRLEDGIARTDAPARTLAFATQRVTGGGAVRMVVLRDMDRAASSLTIYTHAHSAKVAELAQDQQAEVLLWDAATSFQARLSVTVEVAKGSGARWDMISPGARLNYVPTSEPGRAIDAPHVPEAVGPEAFVVLSAHIRRADILDLSELPHKRAVFEARNDFTGQWVAP